jgi:hypothetical protein
MVRQACPVRFRPVKAASGRDQWASAKAIRTVDGVAPLTDGAAAVSAADGNMGSRRNIQRMARLLSGTGWGLRSIVLRRSKMRVAGQCCS